ncbi:putative disease resistance protein RGA3 [Quercus robur]|uniref:putative disease resistance protein RGA3 n=1 Tax=Quercus robur TaxID=38942 RepID=UPI0021637011|nr:putative disease resistance protein RGA3 [Quercus robur]XP_050283584.1 putative disease resistance protein RGA3 [Quercus robur]XP_050283585.1 putative disease resistance protein RGA3 [Quercus robur]XP_050283586.1 putative disease resistance protein RGA3 [Quercus robur]XP_050283587.1 putative disease resistance protein RGA3 [Quercus robur]XP_050283588.1 putative disease resistance protein RGA3 [Quercus robur]XP_050283589.1 putative disease resistance protein RGA3 [Quercus robur]XP_05028359
MSFIGEAALSAVIDALFGKLSDDLLKIFRKENFDAELKKWERMLLKIQAVLDDAEEKQVTNRLVKIWLDELEDLAYDVDDILDEFATEALRRQLNPEPERTLRKVFSGNVGSNRDFVKLMRSKIEGIDRRLQEIVEEKKDLELRENTEGRRTRTTRPRPPTTSLVNEGHTYGRDKDKEAIVKLLLESGDAQLSVIPIVGMGGLGKTTLAQLVYDEVSRHFELKAWVCVSEDFDNLRLTKEILRSLTSESCHDNNDLDSLQRKLKDTLSGKKFLLILDDVWNENYDLWTELRKPFEFGAQGSKIVVTARNDGVSSMMGINSPYKLKELSRNACLRVFTHHALDATDFSEYPELEKYGQKIVDRCNGAPLAAKALGGLLRTKHDPYEWEDVLNSKIWDIPEDKSSIFSVLKLSYNYLLSHLKRCFAYCSLFPKDHEFEMKNLVLLWMGEGLVQETKGKKPMEDLGGDYFRDLLNRSFFQQSSYNESLFVMHDLMHDLAMWAAGDLCYRLEGQLGGSKQSEIPTKVRHFSYIKHSNDCIQMFDEDVHLRTFLSLPLYKQRGLTNFDVKYCLFPQLRCLRVLSLSGNDILELPSSIGDLKHLRYLNLSYTKIAILPESTSSLYNLQTLMLKGCNSLTKLPEKIENLVNLRHLNISNANSIREMPAGIAKLKNLQTLCFEYMNEWQDWIPCGVEGEEFPCLRELSISNCPKLEGKFPHHLPTLEKLSIDACKQLVVSIPSNSVLQVLKIVGCKEVNVHGSVKVEKLIIKNCEELKSLCEYGILSLVTLEIEIKSWQSLVNIKLKSTLRKLTIIDCSALESLEFVIDEGGASSASLLMNEENLSCIGNNNASLLEHLKIYDCPSLKCVSTIVDLSAMLKRLDIDDCPNLTSLSSKDILPTTLKVLHVLCCPELELIVDELHKDTLLEDLLISNCEKLRRLPRGLHELCHLKKICLVERDSLISNCPSLKCISFPEEGFHTNLRELWVAGPNLCKQIFELGLHRLTSLTSLWIGYGIMDSFPEEADGKTMLMLPTSLTSLTFLEFPNLLFLSWKFFQNLSALELIDIDKCPKLESLSEKCFPPSLQRLKIYNCPALKQNCEKDKGIMWSKIAKIPSVMIDYREQQK